MSEKSEIRILRRQDIDEEKWSRCIEEADNSRVYANHWYLDRVTEDWEAIVLDDYRYVMPLPVRKKWGLKYVYQPLFCQQLGIFPAPPEATADKFSLLIAKHFMFCETTLNPYNLDWPVFKNSNLSPRNNYLLPLNDGYAALMANFVTNTKRNIAKSKDKQLQLVTGMQVIEFIPFYQQNSEFSLSRYNTELLRNLVSTLQYKGVGEIQGVYSAQNQLCAAVFFLRWKNRLVYLCASSSEEGKNIGAMYYLVDSAIKKFAGQPLILDFEGSMIPGVARFYAGFGAYSETYFRFRINRLPWPLKLLKS